jgi:hypothetical protein
VGLTGFGGVAPCRGITIDDRPLDERNRFSVRHDAKTEIWKRFAVAEHRSVSCHENVAVLHGIVGNPHIVSIAGRSASAREEYSGDTGLDLVLTQLVIKTDRKYVQLAFRDRRESPPAIASVCATSAMRRPITPSCRHLSSRFIFASPPRALIRFVSIWK